ncbi:UNVERIFIED_CONTAM: tRNA methyltransferase 10A [Sesamum latifolium]|uniref:tRNA (guanine(9)-N(1))-methyltransferase n=1 Tax=Sesamum latifolium TaxID=2727402 RepID=A0AAW2VBZ4_9LAMI
MSKNAQKRLLKQQRYEAKKAEKKTRMKEHKKREVECKRKNGRRNWLVAIIELVAIYVNMQIMYCYAINGRCALPAHLWLTGCQGEMQNQLLQIPGYDKWVIEKENRSYIEAFQDQKEKLVYLTTDSETILDELDRKAVYIVGGLVDRNRWKGITMEKAKEQGIKNAKLPIGAYLKMSSSQVLTVNHAVEILLKFLETKDWKDLVSQVIPQRKRCEAGSEDNKEEVESEGFLKREMR